MSVFRVTVSRIINAVLISFFSVISITGHCQPTNYSVPVTNTYPVPGAISVSMKSTVGIRYSEALDKSAVHSSLFSVVGSQSGIHQGKVVIAAQSRMIIFTPEHYFAPSEKVSVSVVPIPTVTGRKTVSYNFTFQISQVKTLPSSAYFENPASKPLSPWIQPFGVDTIPNDFPLLTIEYSNNPAQGDIYLTNVKYVSDSYGAYLMVIDNNAKIIRQRATRQRFAEDFKLNPNGKYTYFEPVKFWFIVLDSAFNIIDTIHATNGYKTDGHDLQFLPGGGYVLLALNPEVVDMRDVIADGDSSATVLSNIIQEFDSKNNLIFEWRTRDHFLLTDANNESLTSSSVDYVHCNSIEFDKDSNFLLSSRSLDEITKIDRESGKILWRLGGQHNQFTFTNEPHLFSHQHDVRRLTNGNITMFDNGNYQNLPNPYSRAVEYQLDEDSKTATRVWEYRHSPDIFSSAMGNVQRLPGGNTMIGWGLYDSATFTEVKPDGSIALEMKLPEGEYSYRVFKFLSGKNNSGITKLSGTNSAAFRTISPNPSYNSSIISFETNIRTNLHLSLYDAVGRLVRTLFEGTVNADKYIVNLDAKSLPASAYLLRLTTESGVDTRTLIIAR